MNPYADVDDVIDAWVKATNSQLFTEWADKPARFFHIAGEAPYECFQITVFPPSAGRIVVQAAAIDMNGDSEEEMLRISEGLVEELNTMMAASVGAIEAWKERYRSGD